MEHPLSKLGLIAGMSKRLMSRMLAIVENRLELLTVEVQEERERLLHAVLLALGLAAFGLLAGITLTVAVVVLFWERAPFTALLVLTIVYAGSAAWLYARLHHLRRNWTTLPATLDQIRKDRQCLENILR
jgi:uncharacterized membrane protein YqjE